MHCANCGTVLGKLEDAYDWLGRPACQACFYRLAATRRAKQRDIWMPLAIGFGVLAAGLAVVLGVVLDRPAASDLAATVATPATRVAVGMAPSQAAERAAPAVRPPAITAAPVPATTPAIVDAVGPSKADVVAMLRPDRPWYWHYEQADRNNPFHFAVDGNGGIRTVGEGGKPVTLEQRWVMSLGGHYFIPVDDHTLRGFHASSGRQVGAFTE